MMHLVDAAMIILANGMDLVDAAMIILGMDLVDAAMIILGNTTGRMITTDEPGTNSTY